MQEPLGGNAASLVVVQGVVTDGYQDADKGLGEVGQYEPQRFASLPIPGLLCHPVQELAAEAPRAPRRGAQRRSGALVDETDEYKSPACGRVAARLALGVVDLGVLPGGRAAGAGDGS